MIRTWTIIGVTDVALSFNWYQTLFSQEKPRLRMTTSGRSWIRTERSCSACTSGEITSITA
jgi:hypothetical protein